MSPRSVELRRRRPEDGVVEVLARITVPEAGGPAVINPVRPEDRAWVEELLARAGVIHANGSELHPSDGEAYVRALPSSIRGSRLWAEEVPWDRAT